MKKRTLLYTITQTQKTYVYDITSVMSDASKTGPRELARPNHYVLHDFHSAADRRFYKFHGTEEETTADQS